MFVDIAERLLARNWQAVLFDYRGSGYSDLDFSEMVIQTEIEDLNRILDHVASLAHPRGWTALWGMSLGTAVVAEVAAQRQDDVDAIVLWGLSAELYDRFSPRYVNDFNTKGYSILDSGYTVKPTLVEGMKGVDTYASLRSIGSIPRLFVAGEADSATEIRMSERAVREAQGDCSFLRIPNGVHGFKGQPDLYQQAVVETLSWLDVKRRQS